jgi:hypothetical protein
MMILSQVGDISPVIASEAKQSRAKEDWIASSHPPSPEGGLRRTRGLLAMTELAFPQKITLKQ